LIIVSIVGHVNAQLPGSHHAEENGTNDGSTKAEEAGVVVVNITMELGAACLCEGIGIVGSWADWAISWDDSSE
jgi:hypothetical protein